MAEAIFGNKPKDLPPATETKVAHQTLKPGRLVRIGVLTMQTDADTQLDLASPIRTVIATRNDDKGKIIKDEAHGDVLWRYASVRNSSDERMKDRGVWIGWTRDEKGKFTVPLMHPDSKRENPTFGLENL